MGKKRKNSEVSASNEPKEKRRKVIKEVSEPEEILTARHLRQLLVFSQENPSEIKSNIRIFKTFLDSILYGEDERLKIGRIALLKEYLDSQKPKHEDHVFLHELVQAWSFASQTHNDLLFSAVTAFLALLFRVISGQIDLRDHGFLLGRTILQFSQLRLLSRGLSTPSYKDFVISPCLRLLTELVSFDGGALAGQTYSRREHTFDVKVISNLLHQNKSKSDEETEGRRVQTIRSTAVRYLLAHLKFQIEGPKIDILKNANIVRSLLQYLRDDPTHIAEEILTVLKNNVLLDGDLPRQTRSQILTGRCLSAIVALYKVDTESTKTPGETSIQAKAHEFLLLACTKSALGVLLPTSGWYPPGTEQKHITELDEEDESFIDIGLDSVKWFNDYEEEVPVRNVILADFIQDLRPYANEREKELILAIFEAAPELVANYFFKKRSFEFHPKLTATWIGYASLLFSTIEVPVPAFFGRRTSYHSIPPPMSVMMQSILPRPLTQSVLAKCLNLQVGMINYFAIRILTIAFEKLQRVLKMCKDARQEHGSLWSEVARRLVHSFYERCPSIRELITILHRNVPADKLLRREAMTRLIALAFQVTPWMALDEGFDISSLLAASFKKLEEGSEEKSEDRELRLLDLNHLVSIARQSPNMKWFRRPKSQPSPFMTMLKLVISSPSEASIAGLKELLISINKEYEILQIKTSYSSLDVLLHILSRCQENSGSHAMIDFFDDCIQRFMARRLDYLDYIDDIARTINEPVSDPAAIIPISIVLATIIEQWTFVPKNRPDEAVGIGIAVAAHLKLSQIIGEDLAIISQLQNKFDDSLRNASLRLREEDVSSIVSSFNINKTSEIPLEDRPEAKIQNSTVAEGTEDSGETEPLATDAPPLEAESHPELNSWINKDVDTIVEGDYIASLVLCLSSAHFSVRQEAIANITKLAAKINSSSHIEKVQFWLLLMETAETAKDADNESPLPHVASIFAARAVSIQADPTHFLYIKINKHLNKGPSWKVDRLPSYWINKILHNPPTEDDGYQKEVTWLLEYLFDALRTPQDMEIYRARDVFERILSLYDSPFATPEMKRLILRIVSRATYVKDGSTTLVTRSGIVAWLDIMIVMENSSVVELLKRLRARLLQTCDAEKVRYWSGGTLCTGPIS
ncbi:MAG: hypothetical protein M1820_000995 [Bogoriella megaspora]|nr:MAG: hypothetical protein M1820_000995 [Bogoriella megaspora]